MQTPPMQLRSLDVRSEKSSSKFSIQLPARTGLSDHPNTSTPIPIDPRFYQVNVLKTHMGFGLSAVLSSAAIAATALKVTLVDP